MFVGVSRIVSRSIELKPSNCSIRQHRLKTVLAAVDSCNMTDIRISLTDKAIAQLPAPKEGWYLARDKELKGFFVVIEKRRRTFTVQGDLRRGGKRASSIRVSIGDASEMSTRAARATAKEYLAQISRGRHPKDDKHAEEPHPVPAIAIGGRVASITLRQAWERYLDAHLVRKNRSEKMT